MVEPYYKSKTRALYRFANGRGASVVVQPDNKFGLAVTRPGDKPDVPDENGQRGGSFWLDNFTPFGSPKDGLTEDQVNKHLAEIEAFEPVRVAQT